METDKKLAILEAILFASGKEVSINLLSNSIDTSIPNTKKLLNKLKEKYDISTSGLELIQLDNSYQIVTKKEYYNYILKILDTRNKPSLSNAAFEVLSIIAYNPNITKAQIENIRGVNSDSPINRLLEFDLIEISGKSDAPGRPTIYSVTNSFYRTFGISGKSDLPNLPQVK